MLACDVRGAQVDGRSVVRPPLAAVVEGPLACLEACDALARAGFGKTTPTGTRQMQLRSVNRRYPGPMDTIGVPVRVPVG